VIGVMILRQLTEIFLNSKMCAIIFSFLRFHFVENKIKDGLPTLFFVKMQFRPSAAAKSSSF
jgi:hypothetical protein